VTPEGEILKRILEYLELIQVFAWRNQTWRRGGVSFGKIGSSDIIGQLDDGRWLAIEVKAQGCEPSQDQLVFLAEIAKRGGVAFVARGIEDVEQHLFPRRVKDERF
jgi:hypothetical protein